MARAHGSRYGGRMTLHQRLALGIVASAILGVLLLTTPFGSTAQRCEGARRDAAEAWSNLGAALAASAQALLTHPLGGFTIRQRALLDARARIDDLLRAYELDPAAMRPYLHGMESASPPRERIEAVSAALQGLERLDPDDRPDRFDDAVGRARRVVECHERRTDSSPRTSCRRDEVEAAQVAIEARLEVEASLRALGAGATHVEAAHRIAEQESWRRGNLAASASMLAEQAMSHPSGFVQQASALLEADLALDSIDPDAVDAARHAVRRVATECDEVDLDDLTEPTRERIQAL